MSEILIATVFFVAFSLVILILLRESGAKTGDFHIVGIGDVYCPTCCGECKEIEQPQAALSNFEND